MTAFKQLRDKIKSLAVNSTLSTQEMLLQQAQLYADSPYVYGYQSRLLAGSLDINLSIANDDDLHMPVVHKAISRLREFFFVGK